MPIIAIHEEVASKLAKNDKTLDTKDFYLGALAPDAINLHYTKAPKELRWIAHQRKKDLNDWRQSLKEFYNKEKNNYPKNFLLGYITHILTDIIFDDYFYQDITDTMLKNNILSQETHDLMRKDMEYYATNSKYKSVIKENLSNQNTYYDILNISKENLKQFTEKNITTESETIESKYITEELLNNLTNRVNEELKEYKEDSI